MDTKLVFEEALVGPCLLAAFLSTDFVETLGFVPLHGAVERAVVTLLEVVLAGKTG